MQISNATSYCQTPAEEVKLALYQVRIKIWSSCYAEAMELLLDTLRRQGYDPDHPEKLNLRAPKTLAEVETYLNRLDRIEYNEDDDVRMVLATLICVSQTNHMAQDVLLTRDRCRGIDHFRHAAKLLGDYIHPRHFAHWRHWDLARNDTVSTLSLRAECERYRRPTGTVRKRPAFRH